MHHLRFTNMFQMFQSNVSIVIHTIKHVCFGCLMMHAMHDLQCLNVGITPGCYSRLYQLHDLLLGLLVILSHDVTVADGLEVDAGVVRGDDGQGALDTRMQRPPEPLVDSVTQRDQAAPEGATRLDPPTSRASQAVRAALCSALCSRILASSTAYAATEASAT